MSQYNSIKPTCVLVAFLYVRTVASYVTFDDPFFFFLLLVRSVRMTSDHYMCFALLLFAALCSMCRSRSALCHSPRVSLAYRCDARSRQLCDGIQYVHERRTILFTSEIGVGTSTSAYLSRHIRRFWSFHNIHEYKNTNVLICSRLYYVRLWTVK